MDIFHKISTGTLGNDIGNDVVIKTVDMHTSGEATRIVLLPSDAYGRRVCDLQGSTLLKKRAFVKEHMDWLRQRLMYEPRGHKEMYGAILVPETELTLSGEADIGVLFCHNEGYSTMCGHATIALGRFLIDTHDSAVFPRRDLLPYSAEAGETILRLHAPCGVVEVRVPTTDGRPESRKSDSTKPVSFISVPSFVSVFKVEITIPPNKAWSALAEAGRGNTVTVDIAYGGAFYAIIDADELGFRRGVQGHTLKEFDEATKILKDLLKGRRELYEHPSEPDLEYLYGVIVTEKLGERRELGLCFFADQQIDRSPTGSGVSARIALARAKGEILNDEEIVFESLVSVRSANAGFVGKAVAEAAVTIRNETRVMVSGQAYYTGAHSFMVEADDWLKDGFILNSTPA